jgi:putative pyruvate formate lyase activating enzyme
VDRRASPEELRTRVREAYADLRPCRVCPWDCAIDRRTTAAGRCRSGWQPVVASANLHRGEEPPLSGQRGSGTIFLSGCALDCRFCQNWPISHLGHGRPTTPAGLAAAMLGLERRGAHNVNLVTASHWTPQVLAAAALARRGGLTVPIVWNSSAWEKPEQLRRLDGVVDLYLPDLKYADADAAERCSGARDYWKVATAAIAEMSRQVGRLHLDDDGLAVRGLIVRHLVLPGGLAGTRRVLEWIAGHLPFGTAVSLMGQYFPAGSAVGDPLLGRPLAPAEYAEACDLLEEFPEIEGWTQDMNLPGGC